MHNILVVIVTYNPKLFELQTLISRLVCGQCDIAIIDNKSDNISAITKLLPLGLFFHKLTDNIGLPAAQNLAVEKYLLPRHKYLLFFDQDTVVSNNFIDIIYQSFIEVKDYDKKIAAIGPSLVDKRTGHLYKIPKVISPEIERSTEVWRCGYLISSGMLIDSMIYISIGMNNPKFFIDYSDIDLSFRLRNSGYTLYMSEKVIINHTAADKTYRIFNRHIPLHSPWRKYYQIRNLFFIISSGNAPLKWVFKEIISTCVNNLIYLIVTDQRMLSIKYIKNGLFEGLSNFFIRK